jgi:hypothetical protein
MVNFDKKNWVTPAKIGNIQGSAKARLNQRKLGLISAGLGTKEYSIEKLAVSMPARNT